MFMPGPTQCISTFPAVGLHKEKHASSENTITSLPSHRANRLFLFTLFLMTITAEPDTNDHTDLLATLLRMHIYSPL